MASSSNSQSSCAHKETITEWNGTEELSVCTSCGVFETVVKLAAEPFSGNYSSRSLTSSEIDQQLPPKLKASITRAVVRSCQEFTLGKEAQCNIRVWLSTLCFRSSSYRPRAKERMAVIAWCVHQECARNGKLLTLKQICGRLQVQPALLTKVSRKLKELSSSPPPSQRFLMSSEQIYNSMATDSLGAESSRRDQEEVAGLSRRLFDCLVACGGPFCGKENQVAFQEAVFHCAAAHYCFKHSKHKDVCLNRPSATVERYISQIKSELVRTAQTIPFVAACLCSPGKVLRALDSIMKFLECRPSSPDPPTASFQQVVDHRARLVESAASVDSTTPPPPPSLSGSDGAAEEQGTVKELLDRGIRNDLVCNWPSTLKSLLDFVRQGDVLPEAELLEGGLSSEEDEYLVSEAEVQQRAELWDKCMTK